jgi:hypothetical protein
MLISPLKEQTYKKTDKFDGFLLESPATQTNSLSERRIVTCFSLKSFKIEALSVLNIKEHDGGGRRI